MDVGAAATRAIERLGELGAEDFFVIAGTPGTGDQPDLPEEQLVLLDTGGETIMGAIRSFYDALHRLPDEVVAKVQAWDPDGTALVFGSWLDVDGDIAGRPQFGGRPREWAALEDKIAILRVWQDAGIEYQPAMVVPLEIDALEKANRSVGDGHPVVVTADNHGGWHGGAEMSRIAWEPGDLEAIVDDFHDQAKSVRVMPFLEGIPCSIHGTVFPDHVLTIRPVESLTLVERRRFRYAGTASYWVPDEDHVVAMQEKAVRLGRHLQKTLGYRGTFTLDGVLTADGFMPTEVNPRFGVGLGVLTSVAGVSLSLIDKLLLADIEENWEPRQLEEQLRDECGTRGAGACFFLVPQVVVDEESVKLAFDKEWRVEPDAEDATMTRGPAATGGIVRVVPDRERTPFGPSLAPRIVAALRLADQLWEIGSADLVAASEVKT